MVDKLHSYVFRHTENTATTLHPYLKNDENPDIFEKTQMEWRRFVVSFYLKKEERMAKDEKRTEQQVFKTLGELFPGALGFPEILNKRVILRELT